jgi:hypothetical protein
MEGMGTQRWLFVAFLDVETACFRNRGSLFFFTHCLHHRAALRSIPLFWLGCSESLSVFHYSHLLLSHWNEWKVFLVRLPVPPFPVHLAQNIGCVYGMRT